MVTARELAVLRGSVTSHSRSVRQRRHLRGHANHERNTVFNVEGRETSFHKPLPERGLNPRGRRDRRVPYSYAIVPSDWQIAFVANQ